MTPASRSQHGFTLVEVLVSSTLAALVMAAVLSSFVFLGRNLTRLANYQSLESKSREALTYLRQDFSLAQAVKSGTTPTSTSVTLVTPGGEVTYSFASNALTRTATYGPNTIITLLKNDYCSCTALAFRYYTAAGGATTGQDASGAANVPLNIKQIEASFTIQTPSIHSVATRSTYQAASSRYLIRNKQLPAGP